MRLSTAPFAQVPALPFVGIAAVAFSATFLRTNDTDWRLIAIAALIVAGVGGAALAVPWPRLPDNGLLVLPVALLVVIAVLRHAQGGSTSGYAPLAMLPVIWVGLRLGRIATTLVALCTFAMFVIPIVAIGAPMYPDSGLRGAILWLVVATVVGFAANRVIADQRHHAALAQKRARALQQLAATQSTIASTNLDLDGVMAVVVEEARSLTGAEAAVVELPEGDDMVYRAVSGTAEPYLRTRLRIDETLSGESLRTTATLICRDTETDARVDRDACRRVGARSMVVVPLVHDGHATGVLKVYSSAPDAFPDESANLVAALATLIGSALARAELLTRLREQAATDSLTGLPNRRAWYDQIDQALARARRSGRELSVIAFDVDGLKEVNDRDGHAAGDRLLVEMASRWRAALRETDFIARTGGDEFVVLLEDAGAPQAADVLERLQRALEGRFHASGGTATWDHQEHADELVSRADARMYEQKAARRVAAP